MTRLRRTLAHVTVRDMIFVAVIFSLGVCAHILYDAFSGASAGNAPAQIESSIRESTQTPLVSPLLACPTYESTNLSQVATLRSGVQNIVNSALQSGKATEVSVYLRGFKGSWIGINENDLYAPASLLKVPLMITYFKQAESDPAILQKVLYYNGSFDANQQEEFRSPYDIQPGGYKIIDLLKAMIVNSDNNATDILYNYVDRSTLAEVYTDLGLTMPPDNKPDVQFISAKQYSYFFRILYNATYLTPEYSEQALEFLAGPNFPQGIQSAVPPDVKVANKFGERTVFTSSGDVVERDLHDCGIVYAKNGPYILCILTKGKNFNDLIGVIQSIGKFVYNNGLQITQ